MNPTGRKLPWTIGIGLLLLFLTLALLFMLAEVRRALARRQHLPVIGPVAAFTLTNQTAAVVSLADLTGHVWVADIIFTRCAGPCPRMTRQMKELQDALPPGTAKLVTLTTDPDFDTPEVLKKYAERNGADAGRWMFLTGTKRAIGDLAVGSLKLTALPVKPEERQSPADLFVHSTIFVVVDKRGQLRGSYQTVGEDIDWPRAKRQILGAVRQLEREK